MIQFIVNPHAGRGKGIKTWETVQKELERLRVSYRVSYTHKPGQAILLAKEALQYKTIQAVVAIGGDGTIHEVGNGLHGTTIPLGVIPAGTGNDFASYNQIPNHPVQALHRILAFQSKMIDTAKVGSKQMISSFGCGFDGLVAQQVNQSKWKRLLGKLTYTWITLKALFSYHPSEIILEIDGIQYSYTGVWLVAVCNISRYGGGMQICPNAQHNDGILEICCVNKVGILEFISIFPSVYKGKHINHPAVSLHRGQKITIHSSSPLLAHIDGEINGQTPVTIEIKKKSLSIL